MLKDDPTGHESYFIVKLQKDSAQKFLENASNYAEHKHLIKRIEDVSIIDRLFLKNQDRTFTKIISHAPGDVQSAIDDYDKIVAFFGCNP